MFHVSIRINRMLTVLWMIKMSTADMLPSIDQTTVASYEEPRCLRNITSEEFSKINKSVTYICIEDSFLPWINRNTFSQFPNLTVLILENVSLSYVSPNEFLTLSNLTKVGLSYNSTPRPPPTSVFTYNQKQRELSPIKNSIGNVQSVALVLFRFLDLSNDNVKSTVTTVFAKLKILKVNGCQLTNFTAFPLPSLNKLYLGNNYLKSESVNLSAFENSTSLQELHLGNILDEQMKDSFLYNYFSEIGDGFFPHLPNLALLDLQNCDVAFISSSAFHKLSRLDTLILRSNRLPTIPSAVACIKTLKNLDMSYNGVRGIIFNLGQVNFHNLQQLNSLNLSYNKIPRLTANSFHGLTNLTSLNLQSIELTEIEPYAFRTLKSLLFLDLSNNHLIVIINDTFADLTSLIHLKLSSNTLKIYTENHPFLPTINLQVLEFQYNSLCELWDYLITHLHNLTDVDMSHNKIVQWKWDGFPKSGSLKRANFQDNEITAFTNPMLENLLTLETGGFSNNPYNCSNCEISHVQELLRSPIYFPFRNSFHCQYKYQEDDNFVYNSTIPPWCFDSTFNYVGVGIGAGFLFVFILTFLSIAYHFRWYLRYRWFVARCHLKNWYRPLQRKQACLYDAFISYSDKDRYWLKNEFLPRLENDFNFHFCVHERDFEPGRNITDNIFEGIDKSSMFIAILTENFLASQWCMWEMNMAISKMAIEQSDNLVIIKLHTISRDKLSRPIEYLIKTKTYLSWPVTTVGQRLFWERLIHILQKGASSHKATANPT